MGTPSKKEGFDEKVFGAPTLGTKIKALDFAMETGKTLNPERLEEALEIGKGLLLPLVEKFSKPLSREVEFATATDTLPKSFQGIRGVRLYSSDFISIWLDRYGWWFLRTWKSNRERKLQKVDSRGLAKIMMQKSQNFQENSFKHLRQEQVREFLNFFRCLEKVALYNGMFTGMFNKFHDSMEQMVKKREEEVQIMRKWLELLGDYAKAFDPLISQGRKATAKNYWISEETHGGWRNAGSGYLTGESLERLWAELTKRSSSGYEKKVDSFEFGSLFWLLDRISCIFDEVKKGNGRLPFTPEEVTVVEKLVASLMEKSRD